MYKQIITLLILGTTFSSPLALHADSQDLEESFIQQVDEIDARVQDLYREIDQIPVVDQIASANSSTFDSLYRILELLERQIAELQERVNASDLEGGVK